MQVNRDSTVLPRHEAIGEAVENCELICDPAFFKMSSSCIAGSIEGTEKFFQQLMLTGDPTSFWEIKGQVQRNEIAESIYLLPFWESAFGSSMRFSEEVELVVARAAEMELFGSETLALLDDAFICDAHYRWNRFCLHIQNCAQEKAFRDRVKARRDRYNDRRTSIANFFYGHLLENKRLLACRVDLSLPHSERFSFQALDSYLNRLTGNSEHNKLFRHVLGRVFKLEFGYTKGFHCHALYLVDNEERLSARYFSEQVRLYWKNSITHGLGSAFNCNGSNEYFKGRGTYAIGRLKLKEPKKIELFERYVIDYLSKSEQFISISARHPGLHSSPTPGISRIHALRMGRW